MGYEETAEHGSGGGLKKLVVVYFLKRIQRWQRFIN